MKNIETISIEIVPHEFHRYTTCGDYFKRNGETVIRVSRLSERKRSLLVAIHELVEKTLCEDAGVSDEAIDAFDMAFEKNRAEGDDSEPGDACDAPYRRQHLIASGIEKLLAAELGVDWGDYDREILELPDIQGHFLLKATNGEPSQRDPLTQKEALDLLAGMYGANRAYEGMLNMMQGKSKCMSVDHAMIEWHPVG